MADVLVVEDDIDLAWITGELLCVDGHEVRVACNGEEALRLLGERLPDLVVTDFEMPILNAEGLAYRMLIEDCGKEEVPIIIVSGFPDLPSVARRIDTPYFISKPYVVEELLALVGRAIVERVPPRRVKSIQ